MAAMLRVLVIDDEVVMLRTAQRVLRRAPVDVVAIADPTEALAMLATGERFDVILCDLHMPQMNAVEVIQRLKATCPDQADRLVAMTGGAIHRDDTALLDERGPERCLMKPFTPDELFSLLGRYVIHRTAA